MKIIFHKNNKVTEVFDQENSKSITFNNLSISETLLHLCEKFPDEIIVWCHEILKNEMNIEKFKDLLLNHRTMLSYNPYGESYLGKIIGYVEDSPFIKINKTVRYPTWQMSSAIGAIYSNLINVFKNEFNINKNFDYNLNSFAKKTLPHGVFCYSEPRLLAKVNCKFESINASLFVVFQFTKEHYKFAWVYILFINLVLFEKKIVLFPLLKSLGFKRKSIDFNRIEDITIYKSKITFENNKYDVIIPTIGRKRYLYDVLKDFSKQTQLPQSVIIIEQNPLAESISELNFITDETWPFKIEHTFIHQSGACNARNIALEKVKSDWVFFADDDIQFDQNFVMETFEKIQKLNAKAVTIRTCNEGKSQVYFVEHQSPIFGSCSSFVKTEILKNCKFSMGFEFGFGEDNDFGMQLRNKGFDVIYLPEPSMKHLKAPIGGFRTKPNLKWSHEKIQPKPSPTVMLYKLLHNTKEQLLGYKTILFFKYYRSQSIKNPIKYFYSFQQQWKSSMFWANKLLKENET